MSVSLKSLKIPRLDAIQAERCHRSLAYFIRHFWRQIDTADYAHNWHIDAVCEHLEAVYNGFINRLIINIPPRHMKSINVSVAFPPWVWLHDPTLKFLTASYGQSLASRLATSSRNIIQHDRYKNILKSKWALKSDQNVKTFYENDQGGYRKIASVGSGITGEGGDILILDDPHNVEKKVLSKVDREAAIEWYDHAFSTRLNHPEDSAIIVIMQRLHAKDITGHLLEQSHEWEHLCLPAEFEGKKYHMSLGFEDPRKEPGELLWPERLNQDRIDKIKTVLGSYGYAGQYQQRPAPLDGGLINLNWFQRYAYLPDKRDIYNIYQVWDTAQKDNELINAPWVCGTWAHTTTGYYLIDVFRDWMNYPKGKAKVQELYEKYNPAVVVIEDKSTGASLLQELTDLPTTPFEPEGDKMTRLAVESPIIEAGRVWLPYKADWLIDFEDEIGSAPNSDYKDQGDMLSMFLKYIKAFDTSGDIMDDVGQPDAVTGGW